MHEIILKSFENIKKFGQIWGPLSVLPPLGTPLMDIQSLCPQDNVQHRVNSLNIDNSCI